MDWATSDRYPRKHLPAGTTLLREGDFGEVMYFVVKGSLQVSKEVIAGADKVLSTLDTGQYVGEMSLLTGAQRSATVKALVDTEVVEIDQAGFVQLMQDNPQVGLDLMRQLALRLEESNEQFILLALEMALAQRRPTPAQQGSRRMRLIATGSFPADKTAEVLRIAAAQTQAARHPALVTSLLRAGRAHDALVYIIETDNSQDILELIGPFMGLVEWDIVPAIEVHEGSSASTPSPLLG
jgi:CRP-like cAMP-binding protein